MNAQGLSAGARILIRSTPEKVFAAFDDAEQMSRFWLTRKDDGLKPGENCRWAIGSGANAFAFDVRVIDVVANEKIVIEWPGQDGEYTRVEWRFEATGNGKTVLTIEESGFAGDGGALVSRVLDSTGGFNQVIVAAKTWIEHGKAINVVTDHA